MIDKDAVYGIWDGDELEVVGTPAYIVATHPEYDNKMLESLMTGYGGKVVRLLTPSDKGLVRRNKWRDIAAGYLRDNVGLDYYDIAKVLNVTTRAVMAGVSRARCGRV